MTKKDWFGIIYVSSWVLIWGTIGSLIDFPLLKQEVYQAGSIGQITTFVLTAAASIAIGIKVFARVENLVLNKETDKN